MTPRAGQIDNQSFGILQPKHMLHDRRRQRQRQHRRLAIGLQHDPIQLRTSSQIRRAQRHSGDGRQQRAEGTTTKMQTVKLVQAVVPRPFAPENCMLTADTFQY